VKLSIGTKLIIGQLGSPTLEASLKKAYPIWAQVSPLWHIPIAITLLNTLLWNHIFDTMAWQSVDRFSSVIYRHCSSQRQRTCAPSPEQVPTTGQTHHRVYVDGELTADLKGVTNHNQVIGPLKVEKPGRKVRRL